MAKSARASQIKTNRANLRKNVFNPADNARNERLSAKLMEIAAQPKPERPERMELDTEKAAEKANKKSKQTSSRPVFPGDEEEDTLMDVDETENTNTKSRTSTKSRVSRVQKKRRGKSHSTISFPAYRDSRKTKPGQKKKR